MDNLNLLRGKKRSEIENALNRTNRWLPGGRRPGPGDKGEGTEKDNLAATEESQGVQCGSRQYRDSCVVPGGARLTGGGGPSQGL